MKIKNFSCTQVNQDNLDKIAAEVNEFTTTHNTVDIKVNTAVNSYLSWDINNESYYNSRFNICVYPVDSVYEKYYSDNNFNKINTVGLERDVALEIAINSEHTRDFETKYNNISVGLSSGTSGHRGLFVVSDKESMEWAGAVLAKLLPKKDLLKYSSR